MLRHSVYLLLTVALVSPGAMAGAEYLVFCAPGYPGNTEEAQPTMDLFAAGVAVAAGWDPGALAAVYHETGQAGLERLKSDDAVVAVVNLPFYLKHGRELGLVPLLAAVAAGEGDGAWSLVAAKGSLGSPSDLAGWTVTGLPAYHPGLVHGPVLSSWGDLPENTAVEFSSRVLSSLRKASRGENVAVLLDRTQVKSLASLPYGDALEVVHASGPMPGSLLCAVGDRLSGEDRAELTRALSDLHRRPDGVALLETIRLSRFTELDLTALDRIAGAAD